MENDNRLVKQSYDILIVGGGIVGSTLGCLLGQHPLLRDKRMGMIDPSPRMMVSAPGQIIPDLRSYTITPSSQQILSHIGVWPRMMDEHPSHATPFSELKIWDDFGLGYVDFHASEVDAPVLGHVVEHQVLQRQIAHQLEHVSSSSMEHLPFSVSAYDPESNLITLTNGQELTSALVIAADGGQSGIRSKAGLGTWGWEYDQHAVVAVVKTTSTTNHPAYQRFLSTGPVALLPMRDGYSSIVWSCPTEMAARLTSCDAREFLTTLNHALHDVPTSTMSTILNPIEDAMNTLLAASNLSAQEENASYPCPPAISELVGSRGTFPLVLKHASTYAKPGVVVVGDAAHCVHPLAGQGLNLGLADAEALSRILAQGVERGQDVGSIVLLEAYEKERKVKNIAMSLVMDTFKRLFGATDEHGSSLQQLFRTSRNLGLGLFNRSGPVKQQVIRIAMGMNK